MIKEVILIQNKGNIRDIRTFQFLEEERKNSQKHSQIVGNHQNTSSNRLSTWECKILFQFLGIHLNHQRTHSQSPRTSSTRMAPQ
jgi:hypothetical protein